MTTAVRGPDRGPLKGHDRKGRKAPFVLGFLVGVPTGVLMAIMTSAFVLGIEAPRARSERDGRSMVDPPPTWNPNRPLWGAAAKSSILAPTPAASSAVTHLGIEPEELSVAESVEPDYDYFVQSGGYADRDEARRFSERLTGAGIQATVVERKVDGQLRAFVRLGPLSGREYALSLKDDLVKQGCACRVVRVER